MVQKGYERDMCERWVGDWTKTATYWPPSSSGYSSTSFPFCWAAQPGALSAQLSAVSGFHCLKLQQLTPKLQTNWTSCRTGLYHCLTPTYFLWASHLHWIQPVHNQGYTLISSTGCTCSLIDGWVNMLQYEWGTQWDLNSLV